MTKEKGLPYNNEPELAKTGPKGRQINVYTSLRETRVSDKP